MVMEAPPSPQSVGREFVRQYYTLLNKAPTHLHRFYNNQSSFVHGGLDPPNRETSPMIGQKQIHQKIQQLNFRDCHAKITQVDAQATLGNGVVVQVTGELSNAGQPMRRFTQTFVLAAQSPKKYYVHNDIFRYQDEIVSDDECEPESRSEAEDDMIQERPVMNEVSPIAQQTISYFNPNTAPLQPTLTPVQHHHPQPPTTLAHVLPPQPVATVNGTVHPDDISVIAAGQLPQRIQCIDAQLGTPIGNMQPGITPANALTTPEESNQQTTEEAPVDVPLETNYAVNQDGQDVPVVNPDTVLSNEPKTYATLVKSGGGSGYSGVAPVNSVYNPPPKPLSPPPSQNRFDNRDLSSNNQGGNQNSGSLNRNSVNRGNRNTQPRVPRQDSRNATSGKGGFNDDGSSYDDRRKSQGHSNPSFGDSHQLFLGNLPHSATEDELREIFSAFGPIVDLRIHSKPGTKGGTPGSRAPPNYGFITYENQQAVQNCLAAKPIHYPHNDKNGTILNVEEKKTKDRLSYSNNRVSSDNTNGPRNRDNGPRRGPGTVRGGGGGTGGNGGGGTGAGTGTIGNPGGRPNSFNRQPQNRSSSNTYNNRR